MNRALPPGDRGYRSPDPGRPSGPARLVLGLGGLVEGTEDSPQRGTPPGRYPAARRWWDRRDSALDGVAALPVLGLGGLYLQTKLLADSARQVPTDGMRLPAGGFHQFFECRAVRPFQQFQDLRCLAALARTRFLLSGFGGFRALGRLLGRGGLSSPTWPWRAQHGASVAQCWPSWWLSARQLCQPGRPGG